VLNQEAGLTGGPDGMSVASLTIFGWEPVTEFQWYWIVAGFLVLCVWLSLNLINSPVGRALRAVHGSEIAAQAMGIDTIRYKVLVFVVSAVLASVAGSLFAHYNGYITPSKANFFHSIELVTMVVLGGMASTFGAVVGAAVLTVLPQILTVFENYEMMVFGGILMGMMMFMRKGLVPTLREIIARRFNGPD
jgi:branched-chain amino acid transport system permease protein